MGPLRPSGDDGPHTESPLEPGASGGIAPAEGPDVAVVQIAGLIARRIVCTLVEGQEVATGERLGLIRFGSRTDVYLPADWAPLVVKGQRVIGGETVIADTASREPPRDGRLH